MRTAMQQMIEEIDNQQKRYIDLAKKDKKLSKTLIKETPEYNEFEIIYESFKFEDCNCHPETCCNNKNGWTRCEKKVKEYK